MDRSCVILHRMIVKEKLDENRSTFPLQRGTIGMILCGKDAHIWGRERERERIIKFSNPFLLQ